MIKQLTINRFKSIKSLILPCNRVNLFIGAPDTGKSNILEALNFLSCLGWGWPIDQKFRLTGESGFAPLFYRQFHDRPIEIKTDECMLAASLEGRERKLSLAYNLTRRGVSQSGAEEIRFAGSLRYGHLLEWIRYYSYNNSLDWQYSSDYPSGTEVVNPPYGYNLMYIARHNEAVYNLLKETIVPLGWKLHPTPSQGRLNLAEVREDDIFDYNIDLLSDSLKRYFFYGAILLTSKDATLVFDEPDVQAFPPYPKLLGELIGKNSQNQFFVTTHNPYFLSGLVQKAPRESLNLFVCFRDAEGATQVKLLGPKEVGEAIEHDTSLFFNLDQFIPKQ